LPSSLSAGQFGGSEANEKKSILCDLCVFAVKYKLDICSEVKSSPGLQQIICCRIDETM